MSEGVVTAVSYLSTFIGLGSTFAYLATFYLTPYNQLYLPSESGSDDTDVSYTLAIVECVISGCTFIVGVLAFAAAKSPPRRVVLVAMLFFIVSVVLEGTFSTIRAWNLGLVGTDMERTCSDIGVFTGCPTTRYASLQAPVRFCTPRLMEVIVSFGFGTRCDHGGSQIRAVPVDLTIQYVTMISKPIWIGHLLVRMVGETIQKQSKNCWKAVVL